MPAQQLHSGRRTRRSKPRVPYLGVVLGEEGFLFHWLQLDQSLVNRVGVMVLVKPHETCRVGLDETHNGYTYAKAPRNPNQVVFGEAKDRGRSKAVETA